MLVNENLKSELVKWSENHKGEKSKLIALYSRSILSKFVDINGCLR